MSHPMPLGNGDPFNMGGLLFPKKSALIRYHSASPYKKALREQFQN